MRPGLQVGAVCSHTRVHACSPTLPPAVETADVLHVPEDDCLLAGHGCRHTGRSVQVLHVVTFQELQLTYESLL